MPFNFKCKERPHILPISLPPDPTGKLTLKYDLFPNEIHGSPYLLDSLTLINVNSNGCGALDEI